MKTSLLTACLLATASLVACGTGVEATQSDLTQSDELTGTGPGGGGALPDLPPCPPGLIAVPMLPCPPPPPPGVELPPLDAGAPLHHFRACFVPPPFLHCGQPPPVGPAPAVDGGAGLPPPRPPVLFVCVPAPQLPPPPPQPAP